MSKTSYIPYAERPYRKCVGLMVINRDNQVFVGQRVDQTAEAWQMPQGGIDEGEDPQTAALRELEEEIGTANVEIIAESDDWIPYDLPEDIADKVWKGRFRGQTQKWFVLRFLGPDREINIDTDHPEFNEWKWCDFNDLETYIVPFKRQIYRKVMAQFEAVVMVDER